MSSENSLENPMLGRLAEITAYLHVEMKSHQTRQYTQDYDMFADWQLERSLQELSELLDEAAPEDLEGYEELVLRGLKADNLEHSQRFPSKLIFRSTGYLFHYLKHNRIKLPFIEQLKWTPASLGLRADNILDVIDVNTVTVRVYFSNIKNYLTLAAKVSKLTMNTNQWWYQVFVYLHADEREEMWGELTYTLLDLGYIDDESAKFILSWRGFLTGERVEGALNAVEKYLKQPLSLKQLIRKVVRGCMREVAVLEDCYKLTLPRPLQDYLSLRSLQADIRRWILGKEPLSLLYNENYSSKEEVECRYNLRA
ncbi:uncharacterized protein [Watersipora subatra]|uniref:uncharacterized protein n=1 Tax=Watersipora subatra TaxID=2589382 RepID=UPI00355C5186